MNIFQQLNQSCGCTVIEYIAERELPNATPEDQSILRAIISAENLDEKHALIAEALGDEETATHIRTARMARLSRTRVQDTKLYAMLGI